MESDSAEVSLGAPVQGQGGQGRGRRARQASPRLQLRKGAGECPPSMPIRGGPAARLSHQLGAVQGE